jgi:DNA-binding ferritin-like protein
MQTPQRGLLKRPSTQMSTATYKQGASSCTEQTATVVCELMNAAVSFHKLHLRVVGMGSYAQHKALNELYEELPDLADGIAEGYQGAAEIILNYTECAPRMLSTIEEGISYIREIYDMICALQEVMCYSEVSNELDNVKSTLASTKYKLLFLK